MWISWPRMPTTKVRRLVSNRKEFQQLSNEKKRLRFGGCLGDLLGMMNYPVIW